MKTLPFSLVETGFFYYQDFFLSTFHSRILWTLSPHLSFWAHHSICQSLHFPLFFCLLVPLCLRSRGPNTSLQVKAETENLCSRPTRICLTPILYPILLSSVSEPPCKVTSWAKVLWSLLFFCSGLSVNYLNYSPLCWLYRSSSQSVLALWLFASLHLNLYFFKLKSQFTSILYF